MENQTNTKEAQQYKGNRRYLSALWLFLIPLFLALIVATTTHEYLEHKLGKDISTLWRVFIYVATYFFFNWLINKLFGKQSEKKELPPHPALHWPMSGPISKLGHKGMILTFLPSIVLSSFNPFQLIQQVRQTFGQLSIAKRIEGKEEEFANYQTKVDYQLPFNNEWLIYNGGLKEETSHSWGMLTQRYAYDFVISDESYARHSGKGNRLTQYFCYEAPILSAAAGEVITVVDGIDDAPFVGFGVAGFYSRHFAGNHVIIKHADGEYGFYAHLIQRSIKVKAGDKIEAGQELGLCGHSGHSTEPHLHFHLQDSPDLFKAMGLPIHFSNIQVDKQTREGRVEIERGQRVCNA